MDVRSQEWTEVGQVPPDCIQCGVPDLKPGSKYKFRVRAVNSEGASEPLTTATETQAKDPWGMFTPRLILSILKKSRLFLT